MKKQVLVASTAALVLAAAVGQAAPARHGAKARRPARAHATAKTALTAEAVNHATLTRTLRGGSGIRAVVVKAEVLLDRAHLSPGAVDGQYGSNLKKALKVFQKMRGLTPTGALDPKTWKSLNAKSGAPILTVFAIQEANVKGPFLKKIPTSMHQMAHLPHMGYTSPVELLAEKFHMDEGLLKRLNPGADFHKAGTKLLVANLAAGKPAARVARVVVGKKTQDVRAYSRDGKLVAFYPATVGSGDFPSPTGKLKVTAVATRPTFTLSRKLEYARKGKLKKGEALKIAPGPNNPVGSTWIGLNKRGYGIHGTPNPETVSKRASHGCVRLTNWDARELAGMVHVGTPVQFGG